jgi:pimeloyl-ACP methyl ester carboxylesterase
LKVDRENQVLQLADGRKLGFAQYGKAEGKPIFHFTGGNSSRLEGRWFDRAANQHNVNLIVPDRPGFGLSDYQPNRKFTDWSADVEHLADYLTIDAFSILGLSGGSPHVLAVAQLAPHRLNRAAIVSGVAPPEMPDRFKGMWLPVRIIFFLAQNLPALNRIALKQMGAFYADREQLQMRMKRALPRPDVELIEQRPDIIEVFSAAAMEAHRNGIDGDAQEWSLYVRPWHIDLAQIETEFHLWYGKDDKNVPLEMGLYIHDRLKHSTLTVVEDGGHFSTINNSIGEVFEYL